MTDPVPLRVLIIDDDSVFRQRLALSFERRGWVTACAGTAAEARHYARSTPVELAIIDLRLGADAGLDLVPTLRELLPEAFLLILTGYGSIATALQAIRLGADHYLTKPSDADQILAAYTSIQQEGTPPEAAGTGVPSLARVEWEHIQMVLAECQGNITHAARLLGLHRRSLQRKLSKYPPAQ